METKQPNKTNGRKTTNDALIMLLRAGVIASVGMWTIAVDVGAAETRDMM